jgi:hypothetical protein
MIFGLDKIYIMSINVVIWFFYNLAYLLIKLSFMLMDLICLSWEHQLGRHIGGGMPTSYKCLLWFIHLVEYVFLMALYDYMSLFQVAYIWFPLKD